MAVIGLLIVCIAVGIVVAKVLKGQTSGVGFWGPLLIVVYAALKKK